MVNAITAVNLVEVSSIATGLKFDGQQVKIELNEPETNISREFYFKTTEGGGLFSVDTDAGWDRTLIIGQQVKSRVWSDEIIASTGLNLTDGAIHQLVFTLGANGTNIYIDGSLVAQGLKTFSDFNWDTYQRIGNSSDSDDKPFNGEIFSYRTWDVELSLAQISSNQLPRPTHEFLFTDISNRSQIIDTGLQPLANTKIVVDSGFNFSNISSGNVTATIPVTFTDVDLTDIGHTASITGVVASGITTGLALTSAQLIALVTPGTVTKASGSSSGSINMGFSAPASELDYLAAGEVLTLTYTVAVDDGDGGITPQTFVVTITGTNDAPTLTATDVAGAITEGSGVLSDTGSIAFADLDLTDRPTATFVPTSVEAVRADQSTALTLTPEQQAAIEAAFSIAPDSVNTNNGVIAWDYSIAEGALDFLAKDEQVTAVFTVTLTDSNGGTVTQDVTVTITGTNDAPTLTATDVAGAITEGSGVLSDTGSIAFADLDLTDRPTATEATKSVVAVRANNTALTLTTDQQTAIENAFSIAPDSVNTNNGTINWTYSIAEGALDFLAKDEQVTAVFTVTLTDSNGGTVAQDVTVTITGTNDAPTLTATDVAGAITEGSGVLSDTGFIEFADLDLTDRPTATFVATSVVAVRANNTALTLTTDQQAAIEAAFSIAPDSVNTNNGTINWTYSIAEGALDFLAKDEQVTAVFTVTLTDSKGGTVTQDVTVTITGSNDVPTLTATDVEGAITEGDSLTDDIVIHSTSGSIAFADLDLTDRPTATEATTITFAPGAGGTITQVGNDYVHTFTSTGTSTFVAPDANVSAQILLVGGGGGGSGGGGGGGGVVYLADYSLLADQTYNVSVGTGGAPNPDRFFASGNGANGGSSFFDSITAYGGGGGGGVGSGGSSGASSGGAGPDTGAISGTPTQGYSGANGAAYDGYVASGGGGGAGGPGTRGLYGADGYGWATSSSPGGNGGAGLAYAISGVESYYGGGGGGGANTNAADTTIGGLGGLGGGGAGARTNNGQGGAGLSNTGGGGGGGDFEGQGGAGGSGIVIVRYTATTNNTVAAVRADKTPLELTSAQQAAIEAAFSITPDSVNTNNGVIAWDYSIAEGDLDFLAAGETVTAVFTVTVDDQKGGTATQDVTVTITGSNDAPVINAISPTALTEQTNTAALTASIPVTFTDVDLTDIGHTASITDVVASDTTAGLVLTSDQLMALVTPGEVTKASGSSSGSIEMNFSALSSELDYLAAGEVLTLTYTVAVNDGDGGITPQDFVVTITGTNDAPVINAISPTALTEQTNTAALTASIPVTFTDVDLTDIGHTASITNVQASGTTAGLVLTSDQLMALVTPGAVTKDSGSGSGSINMGFSALATAIDYLAAGEVLTLTYTVAVNDGDGGITPQTFVVTITGTNDAPVINAISPTALTEQTNTAALTASIPVTFTDVDLTDIGHTASITDVVASDTTAGLVLTTEQLMALVTPGAVTKDSGSGSGSINMGFSAPATAIDYLAAGEVLTLTYTVAVNDGDGGITPQTFLVTITGTNDAPTLTATDVAGAITEGSVLSDTGSIAFADLDLTDRPTATFVPTSVEAVRHDGSTTVEADQQTAIEAAFSISPESYNANNGTIAWDYSIAEGDLDFLAEGETVTAVFTVTVDDQKGGTATQDVTVTITGTNDAPTLTATDVAGAITEGSVLSDTGSIAFADLDLTDRPTATFVPTSVEAVRHDGSTTVEADQQTAIEAAFSISPESYNANNGTIAWDYSIAEGDLDFLAEGETVTAVFTVTVDDQKGGTATQDVTVTITGTNDAPTLTATDVAGAITEGSVLSDTGSIAFADLDLTDRPTATFVPTSVEAVRHDGSTTVEADQQTAIEAAFSISPESYNANNGTIAWDYSIAEGDLDFLAEGETVTAVFTVTVDDQKGGTATQDVTVTITGTNDAPTLTATDVAGAITEGRY